MSKLILDSVLIPLERAIADLEDTTETSTMHDLKLARDRLLHLISQFPTVYKSVGCTYTVTTTGYAEQYEPLELTTEGMLDE
jgi:hypothetical protein